MVTFDFMSNEELRTALENDYHELEKCLKVGAWKAAHVLAGSIIETVLTDYLLEIDYTTKKATDLKKINFYNLIEICQKEGILSSKSTSLCHLVREYRNLIHPERIIRTKESVSESGAIIAGALVGLIVEEVSTIRQQTYGYTAEQIMRKIETDSLVMSILSSLLKETKEMERKRLLLKLIPQKYLMLNEIRTQETLSGSMFIPLVKCFDLTWEYASSNTKKIVAEEFIRILKEETGEVIKIYETIFFRADFLKYYVPKTSSFVMDHIIMQMKIDRTSFNLENFFGVFQFLGYSQITDFMNIMIANLVEGTLDISFKYFMHKQYHSLQEDTLKNLVLDRLKWASYHYGERAYEQEVQIICNTIDYLKTSESWDEETPNWDFDYKIHLTSN